MNLAPSTTPTRKLQGQHIGAINGLNAADKAKVKQVGTSKGKSRRSSSPNREMSAPY